MRKVLIVGALIAVLAIFGFVVLRSATPTAEAQAGNASTVNVAAETAQLRDQVQEAMRAYRVGDFKGAFKAARSAYLDHFENIEIPLRVINSDLTLDMEYRFADLRAKMQAGADASTVEASARSVSEGVDEIDTMFSGTGVLAPMLAFGSSFGIIFREGLEIALVIAALLAYLQSSRTSGMGRYLLYGVGLAAVASAASWAVVHYLISITPVARELLEAVVSIAAVGALFWVNFWLLRRLDQKRWMEFMRARAWSAMASGSMIGLVVLGFTAVYREGLETALFYEALVFISKQMELFVALGFVAGLIALCGVAYVMFATGKKMQAVSYLKIAVPLLMAMSVAFIGTAIHELQSTGLIGATSLINIVPRLPYLVAQLTGIHPTLETIGAQVILSAIYAAGFVWVRTHQATPDQKKNSAQVAKPSAA